MGVCLARTKEEFEDNQKLNSLGQLTGMCQKMSLSETLILRNKAKNQEHLFQQFDSEKLSFQKQEKFQFEIYKYLRLLNTVDFNLVSELYQDLYVNPKPPLKVENVERIADGFSFIDNGENNEEYQKMQKQREDQYVEYGLKAICEGKVAVVIMAGGQASRLGADVPKGAFNLQIPEYQEPTLFHIFANRIEALERYARSAYPDIKTKKDLIQVYIMTSSSTDRDTKNYFRKHDNFGLSTKQVHYFQQGDLPALDTNGKIMLKNEFELFMAPNGNGGLYDGIATCLPQLEEQGVEYLHICGVDNILNKLGDPSMIGYAVKENKDFISKYVKKVDPKEKVGIHVTVENKLQIIEYSELSEEQRNAKQENGQLKLNQGFICQFMIKRSLLEQLVKTKEPKRRLQLLKEAKKQAIDKGQEEVKANQQYDKQIQEAQQIYDNRKVGWGQYHIAIKNIVPYWDLNEEKLIEKNPQSKENGMKFEQFIFDCFPEIQNYSLQEISREQEFAPIKNRDVDPVTNQKVPNDNRRTAKEYQSKLHMEWLVKAGYKFAEGLVPDGENNIVFVDPRLSYNGENIPRGDDKPEIKALPFILKCELPPKDKSDKFFGLL